MTGQFREHVDINCFVDKRTGEIATFFGSSVPQALERSGEYIQMTFKVHVTSKIPVNFSREVDLLMTPKDALVLSQQAEANLLKALEVVNKYR